MPQEGDISATLPQKWDVLKSNKPAFRRGVPISHRHICLLLLVHTTDESTVFSLGSEASIHHLSRTQVQHECLPLSRAQTCHAVPLPILIPGDLIEKVKFSLGPTICSCQGGCDKQWPVNSLWTCSCEANSLHYLSLAWHAKSAASHLMQHTYAHTRTCTNICSHLIL